MTAMLKIINIGYLSLHTQENKVVTDKAMFIVFDKDNEAGLCRDSGLQGIVEKGNEHPRTSLGCSSSRAG